jgi:MFS family permease
MWPALALGLAGFLTNFDVTAVIVVLPAIARELQLGVAGYAWVMDAYSLAFTGALLIAGALADRYGRRKAMLHGNLVFAAASLMCGLAGDGLTLSLARALQGVGSAFVITGGIALIATTYTLPATRTRAFSWLGVMSGVAMALGPTLGAIVASFLGWRWIFLVNLPACALVAWGVPRLVDEARAAAPRRIDVAGMALLTAALFMLIEALLHGRSAPMALAAGCGVAAGLLATFVLQQRRRAEPIFDAAVFLRPAMIAIALLLAAVSIGYWALLVYLPPFLGAALGLSADAGGVAMLAATLPMLLVPPLGGRGATALGWRRHFALALAIMTVGGALFVAASSLAGAPLRPWLVIAAMVLSGVGAALAHPQLSGAVVALAPAAQAGVASAMTIVMRQGGFAIGIAVLGALLATEPAGDYVLLFAGATAACALGAVAAAALLPPKPD